MVIANAENVTDKEVHDALPSDAQSASKLGNAALVIQVVNGLDMVLTYLGIVPPGIVPSVVNGLVAIGAGLTQWWAKRKAVKGALFASPPRQF